jgi:hypothetical protein
MVCKTDDFLSVCFFLCFCVFFLFCYMDIILSDNLHHSSCRPLLLTAGSIATAAIPICHKSVSSCFNSVHSAYLK